MKTKIIWGLLAIIVLIQFIRIDKSNPEFSKETDILSAETVSEDISAILKTSCYDCHSNETVYPWYTNIAPVSWWIKKHINEGRDELNFSVWATYSQKRKDHKLEEIGELVDEGEMPLGSYLIMHGDAGLSKEQSEKIINWASGLRVSQE